jgi:GDP-mannose 6-dehydrogenase
MRVSVFGLGYVGCVTSACLARAGHEVVGVDLNREKVEMISGGRSPIVEPGLADVLAEVVFSGRLRATDSTVEAVQATDLALICVGTPGRGNGQLDTSAVERVGEEIGRALRDRDRYTVVLRSTVLPGTTERRLAPAIAHGAGRALEGWLGLAVNPEFMREGSSLRDFAQPPMTLVGAADDAAVADSARSTPRSRRRSSRRRSARPRWRSTSPTPSTRSRSPSPTRSATSARRSAAMPRR